MPVYRVLIVDDSRFMRKLFSDVVNEDETFTVASTASDGEEAVALALKLEPDIITMDLEMPRMNGLQALLRIMEIRPTPVIMLSAVTDNGTRDTIKALQYGAFDFIRKPDGAVKLDIAQVKGQLLEKLRIAAESIRSGRFRMLRPVPQGPPARHEIPLPPAEPPSKVTLTPSLPVKTIKPAEAEIVWKRTESRDAATKRTAEAPAPPLKPVPKRRPEGERHPPANQTAGGSRVSGKPAETQVYRKTTVFSQIVAIGTSTGGPRALHEVLTQLPGDFEAPVLVVQHMPPKFTHSLAQRLDSFSAIRVCEASQNEVLETATAYIAPGGKQMTLSKEPAGTYRIKLTEEGPRSGHMPSVDVLFESLLGRRELKRHAVLMTGMGSDGAKGMKALQDDGAETRIAEAEETCIVYGMPRSAVELGAVTHVAPLQQIASILIREVKSRH